MPRPLPRTPPLTRDGALVLLHLQRFDDGLARPLQVLAQRPQVVPFLLPQQKGSRK